MGLVKGEMEDLGFRFAMPEEYADLVRRLKLPTRQAQAELETLKRSIQQLLEQSGIEFYKLKAAVNMPGA